MHLLRLGAFCGALLGVLNLCPAPSAVAEDWPQFRGLNATGVTHEALPLPTEFGVDQNVLWSIDLPPGISSPVISQGRLFITGMTGPETFSVFAFDEQSGSPLWQKDFATGPITPVQPPNLPASATPATDGERLYVHFSTLGLFALRTDDGEQLWHTPLPEPFYLMAWGDANSPIVYEDLVLYCQDDDLAPWLVALDKYSGEQRWKVERPEMLAGYAVPVLCTAGGRTEVVVAGTGKLKGYDPLTGDELWTCNTLLRTIMTTPVVRDDVIYLAVQSYGDSGRLLKFALLEWKDTNQDGKLAKEEVPEQFWEKFAQGDADADGFLVGDEIDQAFQNPANMVGGGSIVQAIRGGGSGDVTETHVVWALDNNAASNIASPLLVGERLFLVKQGGLSSCFDAATGEEVWLLKRIQNLGSYYASPVAGDGKIYVPGENGFVIVLADGPEFEILAKNDLGDSCIATPAIANGRLYFRTASKLLCFANPAE